MGSPNRPIPDDTNGLFIERIFSVEGVHTFDAAAWELRDAVIKNPNGDSVFEQKGVEFPKNWSALATNVVASKYYYGDNSVTRRDPDQGGREYSLRQLIHRVVRTVSDWGIEQGYFASREDGDRYYDELAWLCLNQYGSFNSPVWFNVGLYQQYGIVDTGDKTIHGWDFDAKKITAVDPYIRPQASACFIVSIDDSIDGIWEVMSDSARLFKYGSGVGADWSTLRSTREKLSGGGQPSGPVSFMRVQDATGGTIKSGGKTRRAAIMQTLKVWHPDIDEFIVAKCEEERKAWALIEQGYDGSFNGPAYGSVAFQNVNQSVRLTDEFMECLKTGRPFPLRTVTTGEVVERVDATELLNKISEGTHICGDPGVQYEDQIQKWHTCKATGPINSSNPCSEYMFLDNSACNLASLNLLKFQNEDGSFNVERFRAATRIFLTAMEILVDNAGYPSASIAQNSHDYRPLGLGFANLGALLMSMGLPYDSDEGRAVAGAITAIEHSEAYARSAEIASNSTIGPFHGYEKNRDSMLDVIKLHHSAVQNIDDSCPEYLRQAAQESADRMLRLGRAHGFRNSQVTVLAPTGTISFMMDCDTTGIEPDIALVKYKLLAGKGEGMLKIVNKTVPQALRRLGYAPDQVHSILQYIDENDTIEGAPQLADKHLPVFDCAFKPFKGERSVSPSGHVKMMGACQPFISGAISKTVNMPEQSTIEEISEAYVQGWNLNLKALAIYRENSKRSQPLSTSEGGNTKSKAVADANEIDLPGGDGMSEDFDPVVAAEQAIEYRPVRKRLPDERMALTHKFSLAGHEGYLHVGMYPDTKQPGEIFITMAKQGSTISGLMDAFATSISIALQYGVPLESLCDKFSYMRFEPSGFTNNPSIPMAMSIMDYIFRYLRMRFLGESEQAMVQEATRQYEAMVETPGTPAEDKSQLNMFSYVGGAQQRSGQNRTDTAQENGIYQNQEDAPPCSICGAITVRSGACYSCMQCGATSGCG